MTDLIVIGAGPGGYVAAIRAAQLGMKTVVVERKYCGGTCLNTGCIPTKTLFRDAQVMRDLCHAGAFGIHVDEGSIRPDLEKMQEEKRRVVKQLTGGVESLLKANKVELLMGDARILSPGRVEVLYPSGEREILEAGRILIATGSESAAPPVPGLDLPGVITSTEALEMTSVPQRIAVIGGGVIGMEFAGIFHAFGSQVTVIEYMPKILPPFDNEISRRSQKLFERSGVRFMTGTKLTEIRQDAEGLAVVTDKGGVREEISCDRVLVATGRVFSADGLGLDEAGVIYDRRGIRVDDDYQTNVPGIYAVGDAIGGSMLAHTASAEGTVCVERMAGLDARVDYDLIPSAVFTFPEIACIGRTEQELREAGIPYKAGKYLMAGNGKALTMQETDGMVKVLASGDLGRILGVHIIGPNASDILAEAAADMKAGLSVEEAAAVMHAHPTLSEAYEEALTLLLGRGIHSAPARRR